MGKAEVLTEVKFWFIRSSVHLMQSPAEASDSPTRARILAAAEERFAAFGEELHEQLVSENVAMIADVIRDGIREGTLRDVDPERTAFILFTGGDALSSQSHHPYQEVLPLYGEIVMRGLVPR